MAKNYYIVLGIKSDATLDEIKSAYRQQAKEYHPDYYGGDSGPFRDIQKAYSVLTNPKLRRDYDDQICEARAKRTPGVNGAEPLIPERKRKIEPLIEDDMDDISLTRSFQSYHPSFDEIFDRLWSNFSNLSHPKSETIQSLTVEVPIRPDQGRQGGHVRIMVPTIAVCPTCRGQGGIGPYECWRCTGEGSISGEYPLLVAFPAGIQNHHTLEIPLSRFGIHNLYLKVIFRVADIGY